MAKLVLIRHGQSVWNKENKFTGWTDVELSEKGMIEAHECAKKLENFQFDLAYTSVLKRAIDTLQIIINDNKWLTLPIIKDKAINERMYGDLQGHNKDEMRKKVGEEQVHIWRRSYDVAPPNGESLQDTASRAIPYFKEKILKDVMAGKNVLVSAHGNSLRAILMHLENISAQDIPNLNIPTGVPYVYEISSDGKVLSKEILQ